MEEFIYKSAFILISSHVRSPLLLVTQTQVPGGAVSNPSKICKQDSECNVITLHNFSVN